MARVLAQPPRKRLQGNCRGVTQPPPIGAALGRGRDRLRAGRQYRLRRAVGQYLGPHGRTVVSVELGADGTATASGLARRVSAPRSRCSSTKAARSSYRIGSGCSRNRICRAGGNSRLFGGSIIWRALRTMMMGDSHAGPHGPLRSSPATGTPVFGSAVGRCFSHQSDSRRVEFALKLSDVRGELVFLLP